jgi:hypothetical protein
VVDKSKLDTAVPTKVTIKIDAKSESVLVTDDLARSWGRNLVVGEILSNNPKRQTVRWELEGFPEQKLTTRGQSNVFSKAAFKMSIFKKKNTAKFVVEPMGRASYYENMIIRSAKCTQG